jgi:hypothetical protein
MTQQIRIETPKASFTGVGYKHTNQRKAIIATLPLLMAMFIRGHTHASPEPRPTGFCKHPPTHTVHEEVTGIGI